jgi:hypothetical protein
MGNSIGKSVCKSKITSVGRPIGKSIVKSKLT